MNFKQGFLALILAGSTAIALVSQARAGTVEGTVTYRERIAMPAGARLLVELRDVSLADAPSKLIAAQEYILAGVPANYRLSFGDEAIEAGSSYSVSARIMLNGELWFINDTSYPVLTQGAGDRADLIVKRVQETPPAGEDLHLEGSKWRLIELNGAPVTEGRNPGFAFGADGHFAGSSGCNRFSGQAGISGSEIDFPERVAGTMMACAPELGAQEEAFLLAMSNVKTMERQGPLLRLLANDGTALMVLQIEE